MIMKVAVPPEKHSPRFGQDAQTLCSLKLAQQLLDAVDPGKPGRTRIQSGFFGSSSVGMIFTGIRATFSAPRSFTPTSTLPPAFRTSSTTVLMSVRSRP